MKIIISIIFSALFGAVISGSPVEGLKLNPLKTDYFEKSEPCTLRIRLCYIVSGFPSFKKEPCKGLGLRCLEWENCKKIERFNPSSVQDGKTQILFENLSLNEFKITFNSSEKNENSFIVDQPTKLPRQIASDFGLGSITVSPGTYPVNINPDNTISTIIKVKSE